MQETRIAYVSFITLERSASHHFEALSYPTLCSPLLLPLTPPPPLRLASFSPSLYLRRIFLDERISVSPFSLVLLENLAKLSKTSVSCSQRCCIQPAGGGVRVHTHTLAYTRACVASALLTGQNGNGGWSGCVQSVEEDRARGARGGGFKASSSILRFLIAKPSLFM